MRVEPELPDHPKYQRLKRRIGDYACEALIRLWGHCQTNQRGDTWPGADEEYVEIICKWDGEKGLLFRSLVETGWIDRLEGALQIHDWEDMNSSTVSAWRNGPRGGRPKKGNSHAGNNRPETDRKPTGLAPGSKSVSAISGDPSGNNRPETDRLTGIESGLTEQKPDALSVFPSFSPSSEEPTGNRPETDRLSEPTLRYDLAQQVLDHLNAITGAQFRGTKLELDLVASCLARVANDIDSVKKMVARQKALWWNEPRLRSCLQPRTLFEPEKFDSYYALREVPIQAGDPIARRRELEELIAKSPANRQSVFHRADASAEEIAALKNHRRELAELNAVKNAAAA